MNFRKLFVPALAVILLASCDDTTDEIGQSLIKKNNVTISTGTFAVASRSMKVDSVLSRNSTAYLGHVKDPETGSYITGNAMLQFHTLPNIGFPVKDSIVSRIANDIVADSCDIFLACDDFYGDSLSVFTLTAHEMGKPMLETRKYYSNYDPSHLLRTGGIHQDQSYTLTSSYDKTKGIRISLNEPYTDKDGRTYNNYGTYLMRTYFKHREYFSSSYNFLTNVCPGFYFKNKSGLGAMAYIAASQMNIYYRARINGKDSVRWVSFAGTEEVLQTSKISHDATLSTLAADASCTYLKTPAGLFTELTLPVADIFAGHEHDTINNVKLSIARINNTTHSPYTLEAATHLLLLPTDSLHAFFEQDRLIDNKVSFLATLNANTYTFDNISGLITAMSKADKSNANWNKVLLVPVTVVTTTRRTSSGGTETVITNIVHNMALTSTRLVRGTGSTDSPIKVSVIYSTFQ